MNCDGAWRRYVKVLELKLKMLNQTGKEDSLITLYKDTDMLVSVELSFFSGMLFVAPLDVVCMCVCQPVDISVLWQILDWTGLVLPHSCGFKAFIEKKNSGYRGLF